MARCKYKGQFGPLVIGEEATRAEAKESEGAKDVYGHLVTDKHAATGAPPVEAAEEQTAAEAALEEDALSVRAIKLALKETSAPSVLDQFARAEFMRPDGARKSVVSILLAKEKGREQPAPRAESVEALESKLMELGG